MNGADARTGKHRIGSLWYHWQVNYDAVAFSDAKIFQNIRHPAHRTVQISVGDVLCFILGAVRLPNDRRLITSCLEVTINAVCRYVQSAVSEPVDGNVAQRVVDVLDLCEGFHPVDAFSLRAPKSIGVRNRGGIHFFVFRSIHMRVLRHCRRRGIGLCCVCCIGHVFPP